MTAMNLFRDLMVMLYSGERRDMISIHSLLFADGACSRMGPHSLHFFVYSVTGSTTTSTQPRVYTNLTVFSATDITYLPTISSSPSLCQYHLLQSPCLSRFSTLPTHPSTPSTYSPSLQTCYSEGWAVLVHTDRWLWTRSRKRRRGLILASWEVDSPVR